MRMDDEISYVRGYLKKGLVKNVLTKSSQKVIKAIDLERGCPELSELLGIRQNLEIMRNEYAKVRIPQRERV